MRLATNRQLSSPVNTKINYCEIKIIDIIVITGVSTPAKLFSIHAHNVEKMTTVIQAIQQNYTNMDGSMENATTLSDIFTDNIVNNDHGRSVTDMIENLNNRISMPIRDSTPGSALHTARSNTNVNGQLHFSDAKAKSSTNSSFEAGESRLRASTPPKAHMYNKNQLPVSANTIFPEV